MFIFYLFIFFTKENSQNAPLVHATLETLLRFLNWIPLGYIFETKLISTLIYKVWCSVCVAVRVCVCVCVPFVAK